MISGGALMIQSYLVLDDDNKRLNSNKEVFEWLIRVLDHAIRERRWNNWEIAAIEVIKVEASFNLILCHGSMKLNLFILSRL